MAARIDMTGQVFGRLTVLSRCPVNFRNWRCRCECGRETTVLKGNLTRNDIVSCGCLRRELTRKRMTGSRNPLWNGGPEGRNDYRHLHGVALPDGTTKTNIPEHIYVMSWILKRRLLPGETVHHKNGIKCDNTLDNLELRVKSHPHGQSVPDMVSWAKELLQRYEPESLRWAKVQTT